MKERLQKILSAYGVSSRRKAEEMIASGMVHINGVVAKLGDSADPETDTITIGGKPLSQKPEKVYLMLNKPKGYLTTVSDERGRETVMDILDLPEKVYPVGRLDLNSEGLLFMTNDGELTYRLTHPKHEIEKEYLVGILGDIKNIPHLSESMEIDGYRIKPAKVKVINASHPERATVSIIIHEGRNRQIRKMCEQCGFRVYLLKRISMGKLKLGDLPSGKWRFLSDSEVAYLQEIAGI